MARLVGGYAGVLQIDGAVAGLTGADSYWVITGQTPPRVKEGQIANALLAVCSAPASMSLTLRLMAGQGLSSERRAEDQTGSTAMPHKSNPRFAERVEGLQIVARGFAQMLTDTMGKTWNEGDVSDSAARRVAIPGLFATVDGLLRTFMVALDRFDPNLDEISREVSRHRWELDSGRLLAIAIRNGVPREKAHRRLRAWFDNSNRLPISHLVQALNCSAAELDAYLDCRDQTIPDIGVTQDQIDAIQGAIKLKIEQFPQEAGYEPNGML
jgi:adenylosuccinate lyase